MGVDLEIQAWLSFGRDSSPPLNFELRSSAPTLSVVGPSGSGKSSLLRVWAGLEPRACGLVKFRGQTWQDSAAGVFIPAWRRRVGWVPQDALLFPHLNVAQNLGFSRPRREALVEMAEVLGISPLLARKPRHLSGGEKQRVALGRALLAEPVLLLLDEPFSALEENRREGLLGKLLALCVQRGTALILVTHQRREAALCDETWSINARDLTAENRCAAPQWNPLPDPILPTIRV